MTSYPEALVELEAAESAGFESLWAGEHLILPESSTRMPATTRLLNPLLSLAFITPHKPHSPGQAFCPPQHQPLILAKELATLDVLSGGRLMVGIGVGWPEEEYEALGVTFHDRGARADEIWVPCVPSGARKSLPITEITSRFKGCRHIRIQFNSPLLHDHW